MIKVVPETRLLLENLMVSKRIPRVCGVVPEEKNACQRVKTYSLRMRGCSQCGHAQMLLHLVFPAYAGLFLNIRDQALYRTRIPRVCGVVPLLAHQSPENKPFSPRMRG